MKKRVKKLTLNRETIRSLDEQELRPIVGATASDCVCSITNCTTVCIFQVPGCEG